MSTAASKPPTVHEALALVMGDVQAVGKTGKNTQQNYNFRGVDAVVNAVGPAARERGVRFVPSSTKYEAERYTTKTGAIMRGVTLTVDYRIYGPAGDYIDAQVVGESSDSGDKALPKAHSVAYRTMLLQVLCIPTDEPDPDSESHERAQPKPTPAPDPVAFTPADTRKRVDAIVKRLMGRGWITPQQVASACEVALSDGAQLDDLNLVLDGLSETELSALADRLVTYGKNKDAEAA